MKMKKMEKLLDESKKNRSVISAYIGNVEKVNDKSVLFSFFDADGEWYSPDKIKYKEVDVIHFADRYAEVFSKYVTDRNDERA